MADFIVIQGDQVLFDPGFGAATVVVQPGAMSASGKASGGDKVCVKGDEGRVAVQGCTYTAGPYAIPGSGTLTIAALAADQVARKTRSGGKSVLLVGGDFTAKFEVQVPAQMTTPSGKTEQDTTTTYMGTGHFVTANRKSRGT